MPRKDVPYELYTEAARVNQKDGTGPGLGATLYQRVSGKLYVIGYASKKPTKAEENYSQTMME